MGLDVQFTFGQADGLGVRFADSLAEGEDIGRIAHNKYKSLVYCFIFVCNSHNYLYTYHH